MTYCDTYKKQQTENVDLILNKRKFLDLDER